MRLDLHPVGQEFFDVKSRLAKERAAFPVAHDVELNLIFARGRLVVGRETQLREAHRRHRDFAHLRLRAAGVDHFHFEWEAVELPAPVSLLHDATDVHFVARAIDAALGEDEGVELFGGDVFDAVDVEAREIKPAIRAFERHEGDVVGQPRHEGDGFSFPLQFA